MLRTVRCVNGACERSGIVVTVPDHLVARGVVARPPLHCAVCGQQIADMAREVPVEAAVKSPPERTVKRPPVRRTS